MPSQKAMPLPKKTKEKPPKPAPAVPVQEKPPEPPPAPPPVQVTSDSLLTLRTSSVSESLKTLKCAECGAMNTPSEWYCERCGAELANI
jgi:hypothetical protein